MHASLERSYSKFNNTKLTHRLYSLLHFIVFVWACVDENRRRMEKYHTSVEELAAAMVRQQMEQQNYTNKGPYNVPPGMVLVPIETLAKLNEVPPTYNEQAAEN